MQKMDNPISDQPWGEPEIIQAEVVEVTPGAPWEWREVRPVRPRRRWWLPLLLFVATCLSTLFVGTSMVKEEGFQGILMGLCYAVPVMTILLCHEMGHFIQAYRYGVYASLPYFIPMPIPPFGTFGAVIAMEPRIGGRRALFDIGISGPLAGLGADIHFFEYRLAALAFCIPPEGRDSFWCSAAAYFSHRLDPWTGPEGNGNRFRPHGVCRLGRAVHHVVEPDSHWAARRRTRPLRLAASEGP